MKIVIKEWLKDKKACVAMVMSFLLEIIYIVSNARLVVIISQALSRPEEIINNIMIIGGISMIMIVSGSVSAYLEKTAVFHCFSEVNNRWGDKILDADVEMFTKYSCASIYTATEFLWNITGVGRQLLRFMLNIINMVVVLYTMWQVGGNMVIPVIIVYAAGALVMKVLYNKLRKTDRELSKSKKKRNQEIENIINGFLEVRSFDKVDWHKNRLHQMNDDVYALGQKRVFQYSIVNSAIGSTDSLGLIGVVWYTSGQLISGLISQAQAMSLVMLVFKLLDPLRKILEFIDELSQNLSLSKEFERVMNYENKVGDKGEIILDQFNDSIELKNVSFTYNNSSDVLQNISLQIRKGEKIGICGTSGAGKSTVFKLLNKFYVPSEGCITIDGIDIQDITNSSYRRFIGSVHQENMIFPGSIRENIEYGSKKHDEAEFVDACKKAKIYDFVMGLEDGFETEVGPRGLKLSGGQKQRIALARLFLCNPEIILLDEATSALDNENESLIQDAIDGLGGKTVITIAHRLSTIKNSDRIIVMGDHKIIEQGDHESLMTLNGEYAKMINTSKKGNL